VKAQTIIITLLTIILVSCTPAVTLVSTETSPPTTLSPKAEVIATVTPSPTLTPTAEVITTVTPSPMPTRPTFAAITPDTIQVEGWKEYQSALAKRLMAFLPPEEVLCEWEILGQSIQTIYVWAVCQGPLPGARMDFTAISVPAVIHLEEDGSIQSVEFPNAYTYSTGGISKMFPPDVREKFSYYNFGGAKKLSEHIEWRREYPGEPPLIVLSATPMP
jgi:hypothetical protein